METSPYRWNNERQSQSIRFNSRRSSRSMNVKICSSWDVIVDNTSHVLDQTDQPKHNPMQSQEDPILEQRRRLQRELHLDLLRNAPMLSVFEIVASLHEWDAQRCLTIEDIL